MDSARPTAVNLHWAIERIKQKGKEIYAHQNTISEIVQELLKEALQMLEEDIAACKAIGEYGADILDNILILKPFNTLQCRCLSNFYVWHCTCSCLY